MAEAAVEVREILDAAEQAASVQDFASAESFLRQAATLQEAQLGSTHPDLANTLNNLGIVSERTGNASEAESCYRRAYAIARSKLPADDPLVLTSGQNLRDFCAATGRPFELLAAPPKPPSTPAPVPAALRAPAASAPLSASPPSPVAAAPSAPVHLPSGTPPAPSVAPRIDQDTLRIQTVNVVAATVPVKAKTSSRHRSAMWVVFSSVFLLALIILFVDRTPRSSESAKPASIPEALPADTPAPAVPPGAPAASAAADSSIAAPAPERSGATESAQPPSVPSTGTSPDKRTTPTGAATVSLVESQLCRSLSNWRCAPATNPAEPGVLIFYTRVKSARDTTVQHRWYLNGNLRRSVDLRVGANSGGGYRTFSRNTIAVERRGNWTIEVRDAEGALLHEERFLVQ